MKTEEKVKCPYEKKCGGCKYQGIPYEKQLKEKEKEVRKLLKDYGKPEPILGMEDPYYYRNKVHATYKHMRNGDIAVGRYEGEAADNGCLLLLLRQKAVTFCLEIPSVGVQFKYFLHDRPCVEILDGKLRDHSFRIFTKHFQCQHILLLKFCKLSLKKKRTGTKTRSQPSLFYSPPSLVLKRYYRNIGFVFLLLGKLHCSVNQCIKSVVLAHSDELVRIVDSAPLADDDVTGLYDLTAKLLDTESF